MKSLREAFLKCAEAFDGLSLDKETAKQSLALLRDASRGCAEAQRAVKRLKADINRYFKGLRKNKREEKRFLRQSRRALMLKQCGKPADRAIKPACIMDVRQARRDMAEFLRETASHFPD